MISAKEARKKTDDINIKKNDIAMSFAKNEWEHYIEPKIEAAVENGDYKCEYFWCASVFEEMGIDYIKFVNQLVALAVSLGYKIKPDYDYLMFNFQKLTVRISWRNE